MFNIFVNYSDETYNLLNNIFKNKNVIKNKKPQLKIILIDISNKKQLLILKNAGINTVPSINDDSNIISGVSQVSEYINNLTKSPTTQKDSIKSDYENYTKDIINDPDEKETEIGFDKRSNSTSFEKPKNGSNFSPKDKGISNFDNMPKPVPREKNIEKPYVDPTKQNRIEDAEDAFLNNLASGQI